MITPRIKESFTLAESNSVSCCMDISDGLISSLYQLSKLNNIGFKIYKEAIPIGHTANITENPLELALYSGGDFELLFTVPENKGKILEQKIDIVKIGEVIDEPNILLNDNGVNCILGDKGFEHFKGNY